MFASLPDGIPFKDSFWTARLVNPKPGFPQSVPIPTIEYAYTITDWMLFTVGC